MARDERIIFGFHAINACLRHRPDSVRELYVQSGRQDPRLRDLLESAGQRGVHAITMEQARMDGLTGHGRHQGVAARVVGAPDPLDLEDLLAQLHEPALLLLLDGVTDPHNLGACLRVADAMRVHAVVVPKDRSVGLTATVSKVASGAAESVPFITVTNLVRSIEQLQNSGIRVLGAADSAQASLFEAKLCEPLAWVLGAEGQGLRRLTRERCDELVRIPMFGQVESLNVSVAAGLCLYETRRQRAQMEHASGAAHTTPSRDRV